MRDVEIREFAIDNRGSMSSRCYWQSAAIEKGRRVCDCGDLHSCQSRNSGGRIAICILGIFCSA